MTTQRTSPDFNPYEPPRAPLRPDQEPRFDLHEAIAVPHKLTDGDLRRLPGYDLWYDPRPLLGFIPQWAWQFPIVAASVFLLGWAQTRSRGLALVMAPFVALLTYGYLILLAAQKRKTAREAGLCAGRTLTIAPEGLRVTITLGQPTGDPYVGEVQHPWSAIRKVEDRGDHVFFWRDGRKRLILPRHAFATPEEAEIFLRAALHWHAAAHS